MAAALSQTLVECAPGNQVALAGEGLSGGTSVTFGNQLVVPSDGSPTSYTGLITVSATYAPTTVSFTVPDGVTSGPLTVTAGDASTASVQLRIVPQYVQASEFTTEGVDTSDLAPGELDQLLREASAWADSYIGAEEGGLRRLQVVEKHKYRARASKGAPRFWPWRPKGFVSLDRLVFLTSNQIRTKFNTSALTASDVFVNDDAGYIEILAYAFGNYVLLGFIETIGFSASVVELVYTSGYSYVDYPAKLRKATKIIATELLTYRKIQAGGLGGFASVKHGLQTFDRRTEVFAIPAPAKDELRSFVSRRLG